MHAKGIVHRDVKPENTVMDERGTVKICDFGSADLEGSVQTLPVGTQQYMAPEVFVSV